MPTPHAPEPSVRDSDTEAFQVLLSRAQQRTGGISPEAIVRHVRSVTAGGDWPVQRDALDAVLRRCASVRRDEIRIVARPHRRRLGLYQTRRRGSPSAPYRTLLRSVEPIDGSCDCPDFLRNSLGLCKHLVAVLEAAVSKRRRVDAESDDLARTPLGWDPVRPLIGEGDWLARVRWIGDTPDRTWRPWLRPPTRARSSAAPHLTSHRARGRGGEPALRDSRAAGWTFAVPRDAPQRLALVDRLLRALGDGSGEPALHAMLREERSRLVRERRAGSVRARLRRALATLRQPLYPYQREGVERFFSRGRLLLADDMGLGKTAQAIAVCHALWTTGQARRGLLVVPAALKVQWIREWQLFTRTPVRIVDGSPAERRATFEDCTRGFLVANYEQLLRDVDIVRAWAPDIVVLDEAQRIKNWATKTASTVKQLDPAYRLVLTGTPMENRLDELASIVEWVDDLALEPTWRLTAWHTTAVDGRTEIAGARHLDTLRMRLAPCMLRRVRHDVLTQLPARTDTRIPIEMTAEQVEEHAALDPPIAQILGRARRRPLAQAEFLRLMMLLTTQRIIANGLAQLRFEEAWPELSRIERPTDAVLSGLASPKLAELRELIAQLAVTQRRKVVVFSQWRRMLRLAHWATRSELARAGVRSTFFTGEEGQKRRTQNIVDFHDDPACRVLFATDAGGVGLNLQRAASACINIELPWNPAVLEQRIGRIHRLGQRVPIDVYTLVSEPGIEARIADLLGSKQALFSGLFDGTTDEVAFTHSGGFLSRIERLVAPAARPASTVPNETSPDEAAASEHEIEELVAASDESQDGASVAAIPEPALPAADIQRLVSGLSVRRTANGGLTIEAPPETAATLAAIFAALGQLLQAAASASEPEQ